MSGLLQIRRPSIPFTMIQDVLRQQQRCQQYFLPKLYHNSGGGHREWQVCVNIKLLWLLLCWSSYITACRGAVLFISQPRNQTAKEGQSVRFECTYQGSDLTPSWRINSSIYSHTQLPAMYDFNDQDFSLTVDNIPSSLNFTSFQCIVGTIFSSQGYLFVEVEQENVTECTECSALTTTSDVDTEPETELFSTQSNSTVNNGDMFHLSAIVPILVISIGIPMGIVLTCTCVWCLFGIVLWKSKRAQVSEPAQQVEVGENEAYAAIQKYRTPIETENNPAYETIDLVANRNWRCNSPQA